MNFFVCVFYSLNDLQEFIKVINGGLQRELSEGDHQGLVDIMGHLLAVRSRQRATDELFEPLKETITLLESYGQKMPEQVYVQLEVSVGAKYSGVPTWNVSCSQCFTCSL